MYYNDNIEKFYLKFSKIKTSFIQFLKKITLSLAEKDRVIHSLHKWSSWEKKNIILKQIIKSRIYKYAYQFMYLSKKKLNRHFNLFKIYFILKRIFNHTKI